MVKMLWPRAAVPLCSAVSSAIASGTCATSATAVTTPSIVLYYVFRPDDDAQQQPPGHREVGGEYPGHVVERAGALGFEPRMTSAIDGTQISTRNRITGQLRSA